MNILTEVPDPRAAGWEHVLFKAADDISLSEALYQRLMIAMTRYKMLFAQQTIRY